MKAEQQINQIQSNIDHQDCTERAIDSSRASILADFENLGFCGSRFIASERTEVNEIISGCEDEALPKLLEVMFISKNDPKKFRDSSFAVVDFLYEIVNNEAIKLAEELNNQKDI